MKGQHEPLRGAIRFSGKVSISCSACSTHHDVPYVETEMKLQRNLFDFSQTLQPC